MIHPSPSFSEWENPHPSTSLRMALGLGFELPTSGKPPAARVAIGAVLALTLVPDFDAGGGHEVIVSILGDGWSGRDKKIKYDTWGPLVLWTLSYPPMSKSCKRFEAFLGRMRGYPEIWLHFPTNQQQLHSYMWPSGYSHFFSQHFL